MLKVVYVLKIVGTVDNHEILNKTAICFNSRGKIIDGAKVAHDNHIGTYCIVMSGRGPSDKEVDHISNTVRTIKSQHPQLKSVHV